MDEASPAIALDQVSVHFGAAAPALDQISLKIASGEFLAIVGQSGSGKTTLLRTINRLIEPTSGAIRVAGTDLRAQDPVRLRRAIGYVFQGVGLFPHMDVTDNIAITLRLLGQPRDQRAARADELLDLVRLDPGTFRHRLPHELSGGQRQRVGFARALAARPGIVLMDEPFGALDPLTREALSRDYRALHDKLALTSVMITHDMLEALLLADRIAVIEKGRLLAIDTPRALIGRRHDNPTVEELMQTPRRHGERLRALMAERGA